MFDVRNLSIILVNCFLERFPAMFLPTKRAACFWVLLKRAPFESETPCLNRPAPIYSSVVVSNTTSVLLRVWIQSLCVPDSFWTWGVRGWRPANGARGRSPPLHFDYSHQLSLHASRGVSFSFQKRSTCHSLETINPLHTAHRGKKVHDGSLINTYGNKIAWNLMNMAF